MKLFIAIIWFLIFSKTFFFWVWLWQLKEYHCGRFRAHFETQKLKKKISSFYWLKLPKLTKKTIVILFSGIFLEGLIIFYIFPFKNIIFYLLLLTLLILNPIISSLLVLFFQIPTVILRKRILKKAKQKRDKFKELLVIGITGSYGKTSTKEFLAEILSKRFKVLKTKKHINAEIGIARAILNELTKEYEIFVAEIGAYDKGKIKEVCQMLKPKIGILTGINEQHMSTFGSQENIIRAKYELIESLPQDGLAIFNGNNKFCKDLYQKTSIPKRIVHAPPGKLMAENILMAKVVAGALGMRPEEIARANEKITSSLQTKKGLNDLNIIDCTYSANPSGVIAHLDYLETCQGKKVIVMPCLIELGSVSKEVHRKIGEKIGKICDLAVITTRDRFKEIKEGAQGAGMPAEKILLLEKAKAISEKVKTFTKPGDTVLLESRVPPDLIKILLK